MKYPLTGVQAHVTNKGNRYCNGVFVYVLQSIKHIFLFLKVFLSQPLHAVLEKSDLGIAVWTLTVNPSIPLSQLVSTGRLRCGQ